MFRLAWSSDMHSEKKIDFDRQLYVLFLKPIEAKYAHLDNTIPVWQHLSCVPTNKVSAPHFARLAVFVDRFLWDYNGKPLFKDRHRRKKDQ